VSRLAVAVALLMEVAFVGCGQVAAPPSSRYAASSPEYQLAKIDGHGAEPSDEQVGRYASILDQLQRRCADSRRQLADWASAIKANFTRDSEMGLLESALEQANGAEAQGARRSSCREVFVIIGVAAKGGQ
jgi:hypothetical protein